MAAAFLAGMLAMAAQAQEIVTTFSYTHPLSYQGRTLTRDSKGNYFAVIRAGPSVKVWKRAAAGSAWTDLGAVNRAPLSGREGECASIATDGNDVVHVVFYDSITPNLVHRSSADGIAFGPLHRIQTSVTWKGTGAGGPFLHIGRTNDLHVAFIDEDANKPYYGRSLDGGSTWRKVRVADVGDANLRPSVITLPGGRILFGYSASGFKCRISDNGGINWQERSPVGGMTIVNCRLAGNGNQVYVTGQKTSPSPRAILLSRCDGLQMNWGAWEKLSSGTGADASLFIDADQAPNMIWRRYSDSPRQVYRSRFANGAWSAVAATDTRNYILPYAYWQEFHRGNPADNRAAFLAPCATDKRIYFIRLDGVRYLPQASLAKASAPPQDSAKTLVVEDARIPRSWSFQEVDRLEAGGSRVRIGIPSISGREKIRVTVRIFDLGGKQIAEVLDGMLPAGFHVVRLDEALQSSAPLQGRYLLRLTAEGFSRTLHIVPAS